MTEDTLERWRAEEQVVRAQLATPGYIRPEQVRGRSGLETLQAIFAGELPSPLIGATLDRGSQSPYRRAPCGDGQTTLPRCECPR